ncbi:MAG TPA: AraC family transcriptional regulator [Pseudolabrys sp.]|nr:AraC family transcriptional regulator [Pseudolabrys sp.]
MDGLGTPVTGVPFVAFAPPSVVQHQTADWTAIRADNIEGVRHEAFEFVLKATSHHLLIANERAEWYDGESFIDGLPQSRIRVGGVWNRKTALVPAGSRYYGWKKPRALPRATFLHMDPRNSLLQSELRFAEIEFRPRFCFFDRDLWETALKLKAQVGNSAQNQSAYVEALTIALAYELMRINDSVSPLVWHIRGGLSTWQQKKLAQYIDEHLAEDISLSSLAELAQLSPFHFSRAFKQSFGMPPHRYLTSRRIERAKSLLAARTLSVTEIGLDVGFSETSSFTSAFRKVTGETPTDYRRSLA